MATERPIGLYISSTLAVIVVVVYLQYMLNIGSNLPTTDYSSHLKGLRSFVANELDKALGNWTEIASRFSSPTTAPPDKADDKPGYDRLLQYSWKDEKGNRKIGSKFKIPPEAMKGLGLPLTDFIELNPTTAKNFAFVTIASANHFDESIDAVSLAQKFFPKKKIYYYDIGLDPPQIEKVKKWCNVIYKYFDYEKYPSHVHYLINYSFKAMAALDALHHEPAIMWMDASFRLQTANLSEVYKLAIENGGGVQLFRSPHSVFAATDPRMWNFLVTDPERLKETRMHGANSMLIYKTRDYYWRVLHWWFLCALDQECISPLWSSNMCLPWPDMFTVRIGQCHRQDQSAINTLNANMNHFDTTKYVPEDPRQFVQLCKTARVRSYNATVCE